MIINKSTLINNIKRDIPDNTVGAISPRDVRQNLIDIVDSIHLLTAQHSLFSKNLYTIPDRTTVVGIENFIHLQVSGAVTEDNTAVGYQALNANYKGSSNTAIGSFAISCNINGEANIGVGFHSLAGNINGAGNLGIGNYTLNGNKEGNFNIAIGHGAGYYAERDTDYQFFLGIHPVDKDYICDNPTGEGLVPLLKGNLKPDELSLGIGVRNLNPGSMLQIAGNVNPHNARVHNLGSNNYHWNTLYLSNGIEFFNGPSILLLNDTFRFNRPIVCTNGLTAQSISLAGFANIGGNVSISQSLNVDGDATIDENFTLGKNFLIAQNNQFNFCASAKRFSNSYFNNLFAKYIQSDVFEAQRQVHFANKTLRLGSNSSIYSLDGGGAGGLFDFFDPADSIAVTPYLSDNQLIDAGLTINSTTQNRQYQFTFQPFGSLTYIKPATNSYANNCWYTNISLAVDPDCFINTNSIYGLNTLNIKTFNPSHEHQCGLSINNNHTITIGKDYLSGFATSGIINFVPKHDEIDRFDINIMSKLNNVNLFTRYRADAATYANYGFDIGYISDSTLPEPSFFNEQLGQNPKRFVIRSFNGDDYSNRCLTFMQGNTDGVFGISNFSYADNMLPDTIFNVRSTGNAVARITAETMGDAISSLELLVNENCLDNGTTLTHYSDSKLFDIQTLSNSEKSTLLRLDSNGHVAIQSSGYTHGNSYEYMLTLGDKNNYQSSIGFHESYDPFTPSSGYAVLFVRKKDLEDQAHDLKFMDGSGNIFNIAMTASSANDNVFDRSVYANSANSTFAGLGTPLNINLFGESTIANSTAYGFRAFRNAESVTHSIAIGSTIGENFTSGANNVFIGCTNANITSGSNNIIIGTQPTYSNSVSNTFNLNNAIVCSNTTSSAPIFTIAGSLVLDHSNNDFFKTTLARNSLSFTANDYTFFKVSDVTVPVLILKYNDYSILSGSLQLQQIKFSDNSILNSSTFLNTISTHTSQISTHDTRLNGLDQDIIDTNDKIDNNIIEGFVYAGTLNPPSHPQSPTTFQIKRYRKNPSTGQWVEYIINQSVGSFVTITNRDPNLSVNRGEYVIAQRMGDEYRVIWISNYRLPTNQL